MGGGPRRGAEGPVGAQSIGISNNIWIWIASSTGFYLREITCFWHRVEGRVYGIEVII